MTIMSVVPNIVLDTITSSTSTSTSTTSLISDVTKELTEIQQIQLIQTESIQNSQPSNEFDVAFYRERANAMDNIQIQNLIKNVFKPDKSYEFPKTNGRSFIYKWFDSFPWLSYSPSADGAFCLPCVLFGDHFPKKHNA